MSYLGAPGQELNSLEPIITEIRALEHPLLGLWQGCALGSWSDVSPGQQQLLPLSSTQYSPACRWVYSALFQCHCSSPQCT